MTSLLTFHENPPLSLYIHLPWCVRKCPYCDFNSHEITSSELQEQNYIDALIRDLETDLPRIWGRDIISIFIGGGTPSLFSADAIDKLLSDIRARLNFYPEIEITLEANPGASDAKRFKDYRTAGINRISLGVQSFNDKHLQALGRIHSAQEANDAIESIKHAGFNNFNIDLMFGLPGQTIEEAIRDLELAVKHEPTHLSWYQLTIEPNTVFYAKPPALPEENEIWDMQQQGQNFLEEKGFTQYEVSAFAGEDCYRSTHNLNYWQFGDYLGIGAGAHAKITNVPESKIERFNRHKIPKRYLEMAGTDDAITEVRKLEQEDLFLEFMMNAFRLNAGFPTQLFQERTGMPLKLVEKEMQQAEKAGFIDWQINEIKPTNKGRRYLNELLQIFVK